MQALLNNSAQESELISNILLPELKFFTPYFIPRKNNSFFGERSPFITRKVNSLVLYELPNPQPVFTSNS